MEVHQVVGIGILVGLVFVTSSTVRLGRLRRQAGWKRPLFHLRELTVLRRPNHFSPEEVRLVRQNLLASAAVLALVLLFLAVSPDGLRLAAPG